MRAVEAWLKGAGRSAVWVLDGGGGGSDVGFGVSTGEGRRQRLGGWMGKFFTRWELASALSFVS